MNAVLGMTVVACIAGKTTMNAKRNTLKTLHERMSFIVIHKGAATSNHTDKPFST